MFHVKMQILFTFGKTYKYNHYKNVFGNTEMYHSSVDIAAYGHILIISDSLVVSMARSFVDWVLCTYSGTPLIRTPRGHAKVSVLSGCPY